MSVTAYPRLRSDKARLERLTAELERWEHNLRACYRDEHPGDEHAFTFGEARRWKLDAELDFINSVRDAIDHRR